MLFVNIEGSSEWYYSYVSSKSFCDLYEAEEIVNDGDIYVEKPVFLDGKIYFLEVDFGKKVMSLIYIDSEELLSGNFEECNRNDKSCNKNI